MAARRRTRLGGLAAIVGGLLWVAFAVFGMLAPWGTASVYRDELRYAPVTDAGLYTVYTLPGGLSLLLISFGLLLLAGPPGVRVRRRSSWRTSPWRPRSSPWRVSSFGSNRCSSPR